MLHDPYRPGPEHRFSFSVDCGTGCPHAFEALEARIEMLAELGVWGIDIDEAEVVGLAADPATRSRRIAAVRQRLAQTGLRVPLVKVDLSTEPAFKDGAFTAHDAEVRAYAIQRTIQAVELAAELGAEIFLLSGERDGGELDAVKDPLLAVRHLRECIDFLTHHVINSNHDLRFALEADGVGTHQPSYLPSAGAVLAFIDTLDHPDVVGVSPLLPEGRGAGAHITRTVAQVFDAGKLAHLDLGGHRPGRPERSRRFGTDDIESSFHLVHFLERVGYEGARHFNAQGFPPSAHRELRQFILSSMRTYLILKDKADRFEHDPEIQAMLDELRVRDTTLGAEAFVFSPSRRDRLLRSSFDPHALESRALYYERLDELTMELLLGVR